MAVTIKNDPPAGWSTGIRMVAGQSTTNIRYHGDGNRIYIQSTTSCAAEGTARFRIGFPRMDTGLLVVAMHVDMQTRRTDVGENFNRVNDHTIRLLESATVERTIAELAIKEYAGLLALDSSSSSSSMEEDLDWVLTAGGNEKRLTVDRSQNKTKVLIVLAINLTTRTVHAMVGNQDPAAYLVADDSVYTITTALNEFNGKNMSPLWGDSNEDLSTGGLSIPEGGIDTLELEFDERTGVKSGFEFDGWSKFLVVAHDPWFFIGDDSSVMAGLGMLQYDSGASVVPAANYGNKTCNWAGTTTTHYDPALSAPTSPLVGLLAAGARKFFIGAGTNDIGQNGLLTPCIRLTYTGNAIDVTAWASAAGITISISGSETLVDFDSYATLTLMLAALDAVDADITAEFEEFYLGSGQQEIFPDAESDRLWTGDATVHDLVYADLGSSSSSSSLPDGVVFNFRDNQKMGDLKRATAGMVRQIQARDGQVCLSTVLPRGNASFPDRVRSVSGIADAEEFNTWIQAFAADNGIPCLDVYTLLGDGGSTGLFNAAYADTIYHRSRGIMPEAEEGVVVAPTLEALLNSGPAVNVVQIEGGDASAAINAEVDTALSDINLQYLMKIACPTLGTGVVDDTALAQLLAIAGDVSDYSDGTMSLEALRAKLNTMSSVGSSGSGSGSGAISGTNAITRMIACVRKYVDEPSVDPKWTDNDILTRLHRAMAQVMQAVCGGSAGRIVVRHDIPIVVGTQNYILPPHIGSILEFARIDSVTDAVLGEWIPKSFYNPVGPGFSVEGNVLRMGRKPTLAETLRLSYVPNGEFRMAAGTIEHSEMSDVSSSSTDDFATVTATTFELYGVDAGTLDTRANAYAGAMLRTNDVSGYTQERIIQSYDNTTKIATVRPAFDPTPDTSAATDITWEVVPLVGDLLEDLFCLRAALMILSVDGSPKRQKTMEIEFQRAQNAILTELSTREERMGLRWEGDTRDDEDFRRQSGSWY